MAADLDESMTTTFLRWRRVHDPCEICQGSGIRSYGSTATWRGGIGGAKVTYDVCDRCWGTGDKYRRGLDLRALRDEETARVQRRAAMLLVEAAGGTFASNRVELAQLVEHIRTLGNRRTSSFMLAALCRSLADQLAGGI